MITKENVKLARDEGYTLVGLVNGASPPWR